jgi:hypothetical protein
MAKKTRKIESLPPEQAAAPVAVAEGKLEAFAEDLGHLLGQAQNKAQNWLGQRKAIADHLVGVRDTATRLLAQLGIADAPAPARRGRPAGSGVTAGGPVRVVKKKRVMSPEAREKIAAAQRARWAKQKKQGTR